MNSARARVEAGAAAAQRAVAAPERAVAAPEGLFAAPGDLVAPLRRDDARDRELAAEYPFESRWLPLAAGRMHYVDEGPRDAAPILCLHGNPTWSFFYRSIVAAFRGEARVVAPDHLGCGLSDKPQDWSYTLAGHVDNLERLVVALDLRRVTLVVHDWGGAIGFGLARRQPDRIARLVIFNTAAFLSHRMPLRIRVCRTPVVGPLLVRGLNAFAGAATRMALADPARLSPVARRGLLRPYDSWANRVAVQRFVEDVPLDPRAPSYRELAAIDASLARLRDLPACIVWGERDWCFTPSFRAVWQRRFPAAEVHPLADVGHYLLEEAPGVVVDRLRGFFGRHPVRG